MWTLLGQTILSTEGISSSEAHSGGRLVAQGHNQCRDRNEHSEAKEKSSVGLKDYRVSRDRKDRMHHYKGIVFRSYFC